MDLSEPGGRKVSPTPSASCPPCSSAQTMRRGSQPWVCGFSALKRLDGGRPLLCLSQGTPVTKVTPLVVTLLQPLPDGSAFHPHYPACKSLQMGAIVTFLGVIIFFHGDFSMPGTCTGRLPLEPPKKGQWEGCVETEQNWFCCSSASQWVVVGPVSRKRGGEVAGRHLQGSLRDATGLKISERGEILHLVWFTGP